MSGAIEVAAAGGMTRHQLEAVIETLIDMLDELDGDCDLEEADNGIGDSGGLLEQYNGWPAAYGLAI